MFIDNKYTRWYMKLCQTRQQMPKRDGYLEQHHIIPECLGGPDTRLNMVYLTAREHFIAHLLLVKMLTGKERKQMQFALTFMRGKGRGKGRQLYIPSSRISEICRKNASEANSGRALSETHKQVFTRKGKKNTHEHNTKIGKVHRGKILSEETRQKISAAKTGVKPNLSFEQREAISKRVKGVKQPPRTDQWRERQREAQSNKIMSSEARAKISALTTGVNNPRAKIWMLEREDGSIFEVRALKTWCRERGISFDAICRRDGRWFQGVRLSSQV